jgi:putative transposase
MKPIRYRLEKDGHAVYGIYYRLLLSVADGLPIFDNIDIMESVRDTVFGLSSNSFGEEVSLPVVILSVDGGKDILEVIFSAKPTLAPVKFVNSIKGVSSRKLLREFPDIGLKGRMWEPIYCLVSIGNTSPKVAYDFVTKDKLKRRRKNA